MAGEQDYDGAWLEKYRADYPLGTVEEQLLSELGAVAARDEYFDLGQLTRIGQWKSHRAAGLIAKNDDGLVKRVTHAAMTGPEELAVHTLTYLWGVGRPMASAVMTVALPDRFTVYDVYAGRAIREYVRRTQPNRDFSTRYWDYLLECRSLASRLGTSLRELDRALWAYGKTLPG